MILTLSICFKRERKRNYSPLLFKVVFVTSTIRKINSSTLDDPSCKHRINELQTDISNTWKLKVTTRDARTVPQERCFWQLTRTINIQQQKNASNHITIQFWCCSTHRSTQLNIPSLTYKMTPTSRRLHATSCSSCIYVKGGATLYSCLWHFSLLTSLSIYLYASKNLF